MLQTQGFFILHLALLCLLYGRAGLSYLVYQLENSFQFIQLFNLLSTYSIRLACERKERSRLMCFDLT